MANNNYPDKAHFRELIGWFRSWPYEKGVKFKRGRRGFPDYYLAWADEPPGGPRRWSGIWTIPGEYYCNRIAIFACLRGLRADLEKRGMEAFDLMAFAKGNRFRTRNLHDGKPVPKPHDAGEFLAKSRGYSGHERWDAVEGKDGYIAMDGEALAVYLHYRTVYGKNVAKKKVAGIAGARLTHEGDYELSLLMKPDHIYLACRLIKAKRLHPGAKDPARDRNTGRFSKQ